MYLSLVLVLVLVLGTVSWTVQDIAVATGLYGPHRLT